MRRTASIAAVLFLAPLFALASQTEGIVLPAAPYAWGEDMGWVNFAPQNAGLTVTDERITGYAWSASAGWINFNPTNSGQGVSNTIDGTLGGAAWVAGRGWLPMSGVTIGEDGRFHGTAGTDDSSTGRVAFDCDHCDVETDWRPVSVRGDGNVPEAPQRHGGSGPPLATSPSSPDDTLQALGIPPVSDVTQSFNAPLVLPPGGAGRVIQTFGPATVIVDIPAGASAQALTITVTEGTAPEGYAAYFAGGVIFTIVATDGNGNPVHTFDAPLTITLSVPEPLQGADSGVYWLEESTRAWIRIPTVSFGVSTATFTVDHLTTFAIVKVAGAPDRILPHSAYSAYLWFLLVIPAAIVVGVLARRRRTTL